MRNPFLVCLAKDHSALLFYTVQNLKKREKERQILAVINSRNLDLNYDFLGKNLKSLQVNLSPSRIFTMLEY